MPPLNVTIADFWVKFERSEGLQDPSLVLKYKFLEDPFLAQVFKPLSKSLKTKLSAL